MNETLIAIGIGNSSVQIGYFDRGQDAASHRPIPQPQLHFVPHSGPVARGIHMTMQTRLANPISEQDLRGALQDFYAGSEFVSVRKGLPRLKDVVGSNYCHIGVAVDGDTAAVFVAIDNLVKGAAGGAIQWMNRMQGWPESTGLSAPALGWT